MPDTLLSQILEGALQDDFSLFHDLPPSYAPDPQEQQILAVVQRLHEQRLLSETRERGMQAIIDTMMEVASGDFSVAVDFDRDDEFLDALMLGLNMMAEELAVLSEELRHARDVALAASETKSAFLASMSHELRTPLNAIIGYAELIEEDAELDGLSQYQDDASKILNASRHLVAVISDILDLSKIEAGKLEISPDAFDLREVCATLISTIEPLATAKGNLIEAIIPDDLGTIFSDRTRLHQILLNLLSNANKFTETGRIRFSVAHDRQENSLTFEIKDSGIGIEESRQQAIFEAFVQEDNTTTRRFGGTGLGLAISKRLATMLGGDITLQSKQGEGSCFTLKIIANLKRPGGLREISESSLGAEISEIVEGRRNILVIDDDPHVHELMRRSLLADQVHIQSAYTAAEALEFLSKGHYPDLIFLDIELPDIDGWTLLARFRRDAPTNTIPIVIISVMDNNTVGFALGATEYLVKPLDYSRLLTLTINLCSKAEHGTVLIVDDDPEARDLARRTLEPAGFDVLEAVDGLSALRLLEVHHPDVILLDLMMPGIDGFQVHERLQQQPLLREIPVVVFSAMELDADARARLANQRILQKSSGYGELFDVISRAIALAPLSLPE